MMKTLALIAALVASTTVAAAQPKVGASQPTRSELDPKKAESSGRVILNERKPAPRPKKQVTLVDGWAEVTDATPARFGTVFVRVGHAAGPFEKLRFDAVSGTVTFRRVVIHFRDGTEKVYALTKTVNARRQASAVIDLGGPKAIEQIDITTQRRPAGEYSIWGTANATSKQSCC